MGTLIFLELFYLLDEQGLLARWLFNLEDGKSLSNFGFFFEQFFKAVPIAITGIQGVVWGYTEGMWTVCLQVSRRAAIRFFRRSDSAKRFCLNRSFVLRIIYRRQIIIFQWFFSKNEKMKEEN